MPRSLCLEFGDDSRVEHLSVQDEACHIHLHRELVATLRDPMHLVETGVFLLFRSVVVLTDVLERVLGTFGNAIPVLLLITLRDDHLYIHPRRGEKRWLT